MNQFAALFESVSVNMQAVAADETYLAAIGRAIELLEAALSGGHKLLVFGNGGSAADAEHIAAELVGRFAFNRAALPAIALPANSALLTAVGNDIGFDEVFARQIEGLGAPGDVAWGISTSGRSPNVVKGLVRARERGLTTIAMTGSARTELADASDVLLAVPLSDTARVQEVHLVTYHAICAAVEERLFGAAR